MPCLSVVLVILPICVVQEGIICTTVSSEEAESPQITLATVINRRTESQLPLIGCCLVNCRTLRELGHERWASIACPLKDFHDTAPEMGQIQSSLTSGIDSLGTVPWLPTLHVMCFGYIEASAGMKALSAEECACKHGRSTELQCCAHWKSWSGVGE